MAFLSIDLGTSATKAVAFDKRGNVLAEARIGSETRRPQPGWAEQDPEAWWLAVSKVSRSVSGQLAGLNQGVDAVCLTGQMHGPVLLGKDGRPVFPCILWMDTRAHEEAIAIIEALGRERVLALTGNLPVAAFPAPKLLWLRRKHPDLYSKGRALLMPKDYLDFRLTGELATDPSDASGTLLYDIRSGRWADELVEAAGVDRAVLPPVVPSSQRLGRITAEAARELRLPRGTPVFVGAGDLATAALGNGVVMPGEVGITIGTAGQLLFYLDRWPAAALGKFYLFAHAVPGAFLGLGTVPTGGAAFHWLVRLVSGGRRPSEDAFAEWLQRAEDVPAGARGLVFLPYLAGTGTPHMDYRARGAFVGLTESHGPAELARAVLEGVAYSLRDSLEVVRAMGMQPAGPIRVAGGAAASELWTKIIAEVVGCEVRRVRTRDASPVGAFLLAAVGCGCYRDLPAACAAVVQVEEPFKPARSAIDHYEKGYEAFRRLYGQLQGTFSSLHAWSSAEG